MQKAYGLASALLSKQDFAQLGWGNQIPLKVSDVDRYTKALQTGIADGSLKGIQGYRKFATDYADGNMQVAYQLASALLSKQDFARLGWGKSIKLKVSEVDRYTKALQDGIADGSLKGIQGCRKFAIDYADGDMQKAYLLASALLSKKDFARLEWGKQILLKVSEVDRYTKALQDGLVDGSLKGIQGYRKFATDYADGDMQKAYLLASALLSQRDFAQLGWKKQIHLKVSEMDRYMQMLRNGIADGSLKGIQGCRKFAIDYADGDMQKAYLLTSALLSKGDFAQLGWGNQIPLKVSDVDRYTKALQTGIADGSLKGIQGYRKFATDYADGDMQKAHRLASALLSKQDFAQLGWEKGIKLKVFEVDQVMEELEKGLADGSLKGPEGWRQYAKKSGLNPQAVWSNASALLGNRFKDLEWPAQRQAVAMVRTKTRIGERGFADVSVLASVGKATIPFAVGEYVSNILTGHENPTLPEFARTYTALAGGGAAGQAMVRQVTHNVLANRSVPLFVALMLADAVRDGEIDWDQLPTSMAQILIASGITSTLGMAIGEVELARKWAIALKLARASMDTTLAGACVAAIVEFTLIKVMEDLMLWEEGRDVRRDYANAVVLNNDLMKRQSSGETVRVDEILKAQARLYALQLEYQFWLKRGSRRGEEVRWTALPTENPKPKATLMERLATKDPEIFRHRAVVETIEKSIPLDPWFFELRHKTYVGELDHFWRNILFNPYPVEKTVASLAPLR